MFSLPCFNSIFPLKVPYGRGTVLSPVCVLTTQILNVDSGVKPASLAVSVCAQVAHTGLSVCSEVLGTRLRDLAGFLEGDLLELHLERQ